MSLKYDYGSIEENNTSINQIELRTAEISTLEAVKT